MGIYPFGNSMGNVKMSRYHKIRRKNLNQILNDDYKGKQADMVEISGKSQSLMSRYLNGGKPIGDQVVIEFERSFGKPEGWLDQPHEESAIVYSDSEPLNFITNLQHKLVKKSFGPIAFDDEFAEGIFNLNNIGSTKIMLAPDDHMADTIFKNDILFIDTSINKFESDGVYAFEYNDELLVRRLQKVHGKGILATCDNPNNRDFDVNKDSLIIVGLVLHILQNKKP